MNDKVKAIEEIADTLNLIHDYCPKLISIKQKLFAQMHNKDR